METGKVRNTATGGPATVLVIEAEAELSRLEGSWNRLLLESPRPSPFLTWEWLSTWWKHFGGGSRLFVAVARDHSGETVGIAPLKITRRRAFGILPVRTVEFLGSRGSTICADHLDFLTRAEGREEIVRALLKALLERGREWDTAVFADLAENSLILQLLPPLASEAGGVVADGVREVCPYLRLAESWQAFYNALRQKLRQNIRRQLKNLSEGRQVAYRTATSSHEAREYMETLRQLNFASRGLKGDPARERPPEYWCFHEEAAQRMADAGFLHFSRLECDGQTAATYYSYVLDHRIFLYGTGFEPSLYNYGVGTILLSKVIEDAIHNLGVGELDFLRGGEDYKYLWGAQDRPLRTLLYWPAGFAGRIARAGYKARQQLSSWLDAGSRVLRKE